MDEDSEKDSDDRQQGYLCISADPSRVGTRVGEPVILNPKELRKTITLQQTTKDQTIWMTSAQTGFPLERDVDEVTNNKDVQMGRNTARYLHPAISTYIPEWEAELTSTGTQPPPVAQSVIDLVSNLTS
jgi:hypothetical protein